MNLPSTRLERFRRAYAGFNCQTKKNCGAEFHRGVTLSPYEATNAGANEERGESTMRESELKVALRQRLGAVNSEWRVLTRDNDKCALKLERMNELRTRRLALMTELFEIEQRSSNRLRGVALFDALQD